MSLPLCRLVSVGGRRSQRPGPSPTLGSLGPSHQWRHKSRVSLQGPLCAHGVLGTPHGEMRNTVGVAILTYSVFFTGCFVWLQSKAHFGFNSRVDVPLLLVLLLPPPFCLCTPQGEYRLLGIYNHK